MNFLQFLLPVAASVCLWVTPVGVVAQALQPEVATKSSLSADEQAQVKAFAAARLEQLSGTDTAAINRARRDLLAPLQSSRVSLAFRSAIREAALAPLTRLAAGENQHQATNALLVIGELAVPGSVRPINDAMKSKSAPVRYAATTAVSRMLDAVGRSNDAAVNPGELIGLLDSVAELAGTEKDPLVREGAVLALLAGVRVSEERSAGVRNAALSRAAKLGQAIAQQAASMPAEKKAELTAARDLALRIVLAARDLNTTLVASGQALPAPVRAEVRGFAEAFASGLKAPADLPASESDAWRRATEAATRLATAMR